MKRKNNQKQKSYQSIPELISASDLQRKSGKILNMLKDSSVPYFIVRNNKQAGVIMGIKEYERLKKIQEEWEWLDTMEAIREYKKEKKEGTLKELKGSLYDLWKEAQNDKD